MRPTPLQVKELGWQIRMALGEEPGAGPPSSQQAGGVQAAGAQRLGGIFSRLDVLGCGANFRR